MDLELVVGYSKADLEVIRKDAKQKFEDFKLDWLDRLLWTLPRRAKHLMGLNNNDNIQGYPIFDGTHVLAQRSCVAGFSEGNTSPTRPWISFVHGDKERNRFPEHREFLERLSYRTLKNLSNSNFYHEAPQFYYDWSSVDTGAHIIKKRGFNMHFFTLLPGSYFVINNAWGESEILVREFTLHSLALVKRYGKKKNGDWDWSMFSGNVKNAFDKSDTTMMFECVEILCRNKNFNDNEPVGGSNRQWASIVYETGVYTANGFNKHWIEPNEEKNPKYLEVGYAKRRPFVIGKSQGAIYGERGPTSDAIGYIRSLNKKAVSKDIALEKMLDPTTQGPAGIKKSYLTLQARGHIPLDPTALALGGIKSVYDMNPAVVNLTSDVFDMRNHVEKFYFADLLLFLSNNPKTRTATEAQAVIDEQRSVIGPNLQSLERTYNVDIADYALDFTIENDPYIGEIPEGLRGQPILTEFQSPFSQVQRAFDLPQINQYVDRWVNLAQINPQAWNNINLQKLADLYEDRYQLPAGLNNPASKVEAMMRQAQEESQRSQLMESLPGLAAARKNAAQANQLQQESPDGSAV